MRGAPLRRAALLARLSVAADERSARDASEREGKYIPPRDHALLLNLVAGTTRRQLTLDHLLARHARRRLDRLEPVVREALRLGAFQLCFTRIPPHAAVGATVAALPRRPAAALANGVLRALAREIAGHGRSRPDDDPLRTLPDGEGGVCRFREPVLPDGDTLAVRASLPGWLLARWRASFGNAEAERIALAFLGPPPMTLRANPLRPGILPVPEGDPTKLPGWEEGRFSVQDATALQAVTEGLAPVPGEPVLDLCAGVGGKACAAAELGAQVTAADLSEPRLGKLSASASRLGLEIRTVKANALFPPASWRDAFHGVLLDAPCSNTGVLRRRPEARWRLRPQDPPWLAAQQRELLLRAASCVRPGGRVVYATCSLEAEENAGVVRELLGTREDFRLEAEALSLPSPRSEGGYWARLRREAPLRRRS